MTEQTTGNIAPHRSASKAPSTNSTNKNIIAIEQWRRVAMSLASPKRERLLRTCLRLERVYRAEEVRA